MYYKLPDVKIQEQFREICARSIDELKILYDFQKNTESVVKNKLKNYIEDSMDVNENNVIDITTRIRERIEKKK